MHVRSIAVVGAAVLVGTLAACDTTMTTGMMSGGSSGSSGSGILAVRLTDAPFPTDSVKSVQVYVVRVDARTGAADSAAAAQGAADDSAGAGGWTTIAQPNSLIDLLTLQNGITAALGSTTLAAGSYSGLRLVIDPSRSSVTLANGTVLTSSSSPSVSFPSGARAGLKIDLAQPLTVGANATTTAVVDFKVGNSFVVRGTSIAQNGLLFTPVITATQE